MNLCTAISQIRKPNLFGNKNLCTGISQLGEVCLKYVQRLSKPQFSAEENLGSAENLENALQLAQHQVVFALESPKTSLFCPAFGIISDEIRYRNIGAS